MKAIKRNPKINSLLKGKHPDIIHANTQTLISAGYNHGNALRCALCHANKLHNKDAARIANKVAKPAPFTVRAI